jgi:predicted metal-dependent hydrolase
MTSLTVDELRFEVRASPSRTTVQITVDRNGELIVSTPIECEPSAVEKFVRKKRFWIYTKLAEKEALRQPMIVKQYVTGEGFPYLGRSYRLLLVDDQDVPVRLEHGRFKMRRADAPEGRRHIVQWYTDHACPWLEERVSRFARRVGVTSGDLTVKELGYRWGSCGKGNRLYFHWRSILLPVRIVEYVVVHELVHLHEAHHTPEFWHRVERAMPDFGERKQWLAEHAQEAAAI